MTLASIAISLFRKKKALHVNPNLLEFMLEKRFISHDSIPGIIIILNKVPGVKFNRHENGMTLPAASRKLKENSHNGISDKSGGGDINLEDYLPIDPVPSSKASIRPGPIQHGTPLMPYIPKPSPPSPGPSHPKHATLVLALVISFYPGSCSIFSCPVSAVLDSYLFPPPIKVLGVNMTNLE
ncbi:hypothetical protein RJ640_006894 [Escallonia rubra]|uniref:Uncharacterized protein n=1 Tax=Escallonia rubra TaxID=112253 RepID=A0AA88RU00_9ASTE|nr:hypothetical protein RJ640_006894 [Escallonia rubra]